MTQNVKLTATDGKSNSEFGYSVAIGASGIAVGAVEATPNGVEQAGEACVFGP